MTTSHQPSGIISLPIYISWIDILIHRIDEDWNHTGREKMKVFGG